MKFKPIAILFGTLLLVGSCNNKSGYIETTGPKGPDPIVSSGYIWAGYFDVDDSGSYEDLLQTCRRCGEKRIYTENGCNGWSKRGGNDYLGWQIGFETRSPITGANCGALNPNWEEQKCKKWLKSGLIEIEFQTLNLPTTAKVTVWPSFDGNYQRGLDETFSFQGRVQAFNENKGFAIKITPKDMQIGNKNLYIRSYETSPTKVLHELDIFISYGEEENSITDTTITRQTKTNIGHSQNLLSCRQWAN